MVLIKGKKAGVDYLIEFVFAVLILILVVMVVNTAIAIKAFGGASYDIDATVDEYSSSAVCETYLLNFLRYKDEETNITFAELAVLAESSSSYGEKFSERAKDFFDNKYKRSGPDSWELELLTMERLSIASAGQVRVFDMLDSCSQNIPSAEPGKFMVITLKLEY